MLSVKPKFVDMILTGKKTVELRKKWYSLALGTPSDLQYVYVYASAPVKKIVARFTVSTTLFSKIPYLWDRVEGFCGVSFEEFSKYFEGSSAGYGLEISNLEVFKVPFDPYSSNEFNRVSGFTLYDYRLRSFRPPQNYCFLTSRELKVLDEHVLSEGV